MAISQFLPDVRIGYLYTYWGPLGFVLTVTICREAVDDIRRHQRDREVNSQKYRKCVGPDQPLQMVSSSKLKVIVYTHQFDIQQHRHSPVSLKLLINNFG